MTLFDIHISHHLVKLSNISKPQKSLFGNPLIENSKFISLFARKENIYPWCIVCLNNLRLVTRKSKHKSVRFHLLLASKKE